MKSLQLLSIFLIVFLKLNSAEAPAHLDSWVSWNIGQGQWITHITFDSCHHFDAGGEAGSFKKIKKNLVFYCGRKLNQLSLSHWDMDHYFNIPFLAKTLPKLCWLQRPTFGENKTSVQKILNLHLPECNSADAELQLWRPHSARSTNESSTVFFEQQVLIPGDSPITQEKLWAAEMTGLAYTRVLILGHHGSRTSTGSDLLAHLPQLLFSISSARYAKYHHPHAETLSRLSEAHIPVLKTEDWGNIWFK